MIADLTSVAKPLKVALTGGIGSGKSTVAEQFAHLGIPIVDADEIAHRLLQTDHVLIAAIISRFGQEITENSGSIARSQLRRHIFSDPKAKIWLEQMLHPRILDEILSQVASITTAYCIVVMPLLIEANLQDLFEKVIVVDVPIEIQHQRAMHRDQVTAQEIDAIIMTQVSSTERCRYAHFKINNSGSHEDTNRQVLAIHHALQEI